MGKREEGRAAVREGNSSGGRVRKAEVRRARRKEGTPGGAAKPVKAAVAAVVASRRVLLLLSQGRRPLCPVDRDGARADDDDARLPRCFPLCQKDLGKAAAATAAISGL